MQPITDIFNLLIVSQLENVLKLLAGAIGSGGLAIILMTILVKLVLLPLTLKQTASMKAMQALQPEIKALQKRYKDDRQRISQETMELYRRHGVNPAAGCLPMVPMMVVLFGLYWALQNLASPQIADSRPRIELENGSTVLKVGSTVVKDGSEVTVVANGNDGVGSVQLDDQGKDLIRGTVAVDGHARGAVRLLQSPADVDRVAEGDILVVTGNFSDLDLVIRRAGAVITEGDDKNSNIVALASTEGKPFIINARQANDKYDPHFGERFLWISRLNQPDVFHVNFLPGLALPFILPVIMAVTQFFSSKMMVMPTADPQQQMMNRMTTVIMPAMMLFWGTTFPAGLVLYWTVSNVIEIIRLFFTFGPSSLSVSSLLSSGNGQAPSESPPRDQSRARGRPGGDRTTDATPDTESRGDGGPRPPQADRPVPRRIKRGKKHGRR